MYDLYLREVTFKLRRFSIDPLTSYIKSPKISHCGPLILSLVSRPTQVKDKRKVRILRSWPPSIIALPIEKKKACVKTWHGLDYYTAGVGLLSLFIEHL